MTATVGKKGGGTYSASLLLDEGSYPFSGKFDAKGQSQISIARPGQASINATLHLDLAPADGQMTGQIKGQGWQSALEAGRAVINSNMETNGTTTYALIAEGKTSQGTTNVSVGTLTVTALPNATVLATTTIAAAGVELEADASHTRTAPVVTTAKGTTVPLYAPLYSGKGLFLGWLQLTPVDPSAQLPAPSAYWLAPNSPTPTPILIQK